MPPIWSTRPRRAGQRGRDAARPVPVDDETETPEERQEESASDEIDWEEILLDGFDAGAHAIHVAASNEIQF